MTITSEGKGEGGMGGQMVRSTLLGFGVFTFLGFQCFQVWKSNGVGFLGFSGESLVFSRESGF